MPSNLAAASVVAGTVLPRSLSTAFTEVLSYALLTTHYHDGTFERSLVTDGVNPARALRIFTLSKRLTTSQLTDLRNFYNARVGGLNPFYFYNPLDATPVGSNWDATGTNIVGRVTVYFRGNWSEQTMLGRHTGPNLTLVEVA